MKVVTKHMPLAALQDAMSAQDIIGCFKEAGFHLLREECPLQLKAPWLVYEQRDGSLTYVQFQGEDLKENPVLRLCGGRL